LLLTARLQFGAPGSSFNKGLNSSTPALGNKAKRSICEQERGKITGINATLTGNTNRVEYNTEYNCREPSFYNGPWLFAAGLFFRPARKD